MSKFGMNMAQGWHWLTTSKMTLTILIVGFIEVEL
jgi:hypothetical protein